MSRLLSVSDFRARRRKLTPSDFVFSPKREEAPSDLIDPFTWNHIVSLPDDVAIRTTSHHGTQVRDLNNFVAIWTDLSKPRDMMTTVLLDAHDDFQSALYNAMTGYYRISVTAARAALESLAIGTWAQVCGKKQELKDWRRGKSELALGASCDGLTKGSAPLEIHLSTQFKDSLFHQKNTVTPTGGSVRRLFKHLSDYTHGRPPFTDSEVRRSNGPIYVPKAFNHSASIQWEVFALSFVFLVLARPKVKLPPEAVELLKDATRVKSEMTRAAFKHLRP